MSVTLELTEAEEELLREKAGARGVSESQYLLDLLREAAPEPPKRRFDLGHINTGGLTEAALRLDIKKNGWWEELEDQDRPS